MYKLLHIAVLCGQILLAVASGGVLLSELKKKKMIAGLIAATALLGVLYMWSEIASDVVNFYHSATNYVSGPRTLENAVPEPLSDLITSLVLKARKVITHPIARSIRYGYLRGSVFAAVMLQKIGDATPSPYWDAIDGDIAALDWPPDKTYTKDAVNEHISTANSTDDHFFEDADNALIERYKELSEFLRRSQSAFADREDKAFYLGLMAGNRVRSSLN